MTEYSQDRFGIPVPATSTYAWVITHENRAVFDEPGTSEVGICGPSNASDPMLKALGQGEGHTFRMLDDDGIWYYRGRIVFDDVPEPVVMSARLAGEWAKPDTYLCDANLDDDGFGPLTDFGSPNAGCTDIQYRVTVARGNAGESIKVWAVL